MRSKKYLFLFIYFGEGGGSRRTKKCNFLIVVIVLSALNEIKWCPVEGVTEGEGSLCLYWPDGRGRRRCVRLRRTSLAKPSGES